MQNAKLTKLWRPLDVYFCLKVECLLDELQ